MFFFYGKREQEWLKVYKVRNFTEKKSIIENKIDKTFSKRYTEDIEKFT